MKVGMSVVLALIIFIGSVQSLTAANSHCGLCVAPTICPVARYKLVDLGASHLSASQLSRLEPLYSLAPVINNAGQIVYNKADGAYMRDPNIGEYALSLPGIKVFSHAINNNSEILVSLQRQHSDIEWMVWSRKSALNKTISGERWHVDNLKSDTRAFFCAINDNGTVIGYKEQNERLRPLIWSACWGLHFLGASCGYDIAGFPRGINNEGKIIGYMEEAVDSPPMIWRPCQGLEVLRNYRKLFDCQGWVELADIVISQEGIVYGSYLLKYASKEEYPDDIGHYFLYRWDPEKEIFNKLGVRDMRIAAINNTNVMSGAYKGHAAIFREGEPPIDLNLQLINPEGDWELLEATNINDRGQIVGFGRYRGELHLFLLEPTL